MTKFLVVGLGNIGAEYHLTRHNIGFEVLDLFALNHNSQFTSDRYADYCLVKFKGKQIHCIKPTTYMNLSGKAVSYWQKKLGIELQQILVITDDLALPLGKLRLRGKGSDAGHNGLKNINELLQTTEYPRLRFGIGSDFKKGEQVKFVLNRWSESEFEIVKKAMEKASQTIEQFTTIGIERTMNEVNQDK
jgi:PTH1 family peptidyl-tRNA hydrolase